MKRKSIYRSDLSNLRCLVALLVFVPCVFSTLFAEQSRHEYPENFGATPSSPTLGNYPDTTISLSTDTTVTPDAPPTGTTSINVSTSTSFNGTLEGDSATGVVRVTDAHPTGTYTVTVRAFDSGGVSASTTFTLTVTTPETCTPVSFAAPIYNFLVGRGPI